MELAADERRDLADFLETLTPEQWELPSLCEGWTVRAVVAHLLSFEEISWLGVMGTMLKAGFRPPKMNRIRLAAYQDRTPLQLIELLRANARPSGLTAMRGGRIGLTDSLIHHQDIRRTVDRPREVPPDRLLEVLAFSFTAPVLPSKANATGLSAVATDLDWRLGGGPEVTGPAEALLMAFAGRSDALGELHGAGLATLCERVQH